MTLYYIDPINLSSSKVSQPLSTPQRKSHQNTNIQTQQLRQEVGGDGLVVPSRLALCWIALGSGFESQRGHLFFGILPRGEISQEGFAQGLVSPPATSRYIGSVRIISEAPLVCPNGCWYLLKR
jgi:hypothetical protein